jgi:two-component system cell cycle sensor histidine kinase/response regulator CckA
MAPQEFAHDLNNLLTTVIGFSDLLLRRHGANPLDRGDLEEIQRAGRQAAALAQQLLNSTGEM